MRDVAHVQDARADRLRAQASNYGFGDWIADVLMNLMLGDGAPSPKKR
jgi:hypothetical protein